LQFEYPAASIRAELLAQQLLYPAERLATLAAEPGIPGRRIGLRTPVYHRGAASDFARVRRRLPHAARQQLNARHKPSFGTLEVTHHTHEEVRVPFDSQGGGGWDLTLGQQAETRLRNVNDASGQMHILRAQQRKRYRAIHCEALFVPGIRHTCFVCIPKAARMQ